MKNIKFKQIMAILTAAAILGGCSAPAGGSYTDQKTQTEKSEDSSQTGSATAGALADYFLKAAEDYHDSVNRVDIIDGFKESEKATRLQMLVMASRAFGTLPKPGRYAKLTAPPAPDISGAPQWAKNALENLIGGGILTDSDLENRDHPVSMKDARMIAARFYTFFGSDLKDDFYTAVNQNLLNTLEIPKDQESAGGSATVSANTDKQLKDLIMEIVNSGEEYPQGSPQQKIRDFYQSYEDKETREQEGINPLKKYLDQVENAKSISELNAAIGRAVEELGIFANGLFSGFPVTDMKDSTKMILQLMTPMAGLQKEDYKDPESDAYKEYRNTLTEHLLAAGESQTDAKRHAESIMELEKNLAAHMDEPDDSGKIKAQNYYTTDMLSKKDPQAKAAELLTAMGIKPNIKMAVFDELQFEEYLKWFTEENLELLKSLEKIALISGYSSYLSTDLAEKFGNNMDAGTADTAIQNFLSEELGKLYTDRFFNAESKTEIQEMTALMIETFKNRVKRLDWMSEETKKEALKKLDSLTVLIGYPDEWEFNMAEIAGPDKGGSYFKNVAASEADKWKQQLKKLEQPADPRRFALAAYTVNAAANRNTNTLIFPAGILQAPFYDKNASFEQNLGAIGSTIAHEITHMFDDGGAQYDARGNLRDWWTKEDYSHFQKLCKKAEDFYEGHEAVPGAVADSKENLSENIADIGGIACGLEILSTMENPDYDAFFRSFANQWAKVADYDTLAELAQTDTHAPNKLRCNLVLSNFQEFYDTNGISEGDGMYTAPEDRIQIW